MEPRKYDVFVSYRRTAYDTANLIAEVNYEEQKLEEMEHQIDQLQEQANNLK